jgi:SHS2 domain-containing protein
MGEESEADVAAEEATVEEVTGEAAKGLAEVVISHDLETRIKKTIALGTRRDPPLLHQAADERASHEYVRVVIPS